MKEVHVEDLLVLLLLRRWTVVLHREITAASGELNEKDDRQRQAQRDQDEQMHVGQEKKGCHCRADYF